MPRANCGSARVPVVATIKAKLKNGKREALRQTFMYVTFFAKGKELKSRHL